MRINASDYVRLMVPFLKGLPDAIRSHAEYPELKYYGTGEAGHWSEQCNQQMAGALAVLAEDPDLEKYDPGGESAAGHSCGRGLCAAGILNE